MALTCVLTCVKFAYFRQQFNERCNWSSEPNRVCERSFTHSINKTTSTSSEQIFVTSMPPAGSERDVQHISHITPASIFSNVSRHIKHRMSAKASTYAFWRSSLRLSILFCFFLVRRCWEISSRAGVNCLCSLTLVKFVLLNATSLNARGQGRMNATNGFIWERALEQLCFAH